MIWRRGSVLPRVRVFLWKLLHEVEWVLHRRFTALDPTCESCGEAKEDVNHLILSCQFSRICWFAEPLGLMTHGLDGSFSDSIMAIGGVVDDEQLLSFANTMWAIWRCRNECIYGGKKPAFEQFLKFLSIIKEESEVGASRRCSTTRLQLASSVVREQRDNNAYNCYIDGYWTKDWVGGIGFILYDRGELVAYKSKGVKACCSLQAEAWAMKEAVCFVQSFGIKDCTFNTDNTTVVSICSRLQPPTDTDWRAFAEAMEIWKRFKQERDFRCEYVQRSQNDLADYLAKMGRIQGWSHEGYTFPILESWKA